MNRLIAALTALSLAAVAHAQQLSDTDIAAAIRAGEAKKIDTLTSECTAKPGFGETIGAGIAGGVQRNGTYAVVVSANAGRIASLAANAKRMYKKFALADVTDDLRVPTIFVAVEPDKPSTSGNVMSVAAEIEHVVLKTKAKIEAVVQPLNVEKEVVEFANLLGGKVESTRAIATFDYATVKELPAGADFDVVVITPHGERRCKVGAKDRVKLFPARPIS